MALVRRLALVAALLFAVLAGAPVPAAPSVPQRIIAVGDLHGDYQAWQAISRAAGVADQRGHWAGGKTVLVQLGDVTDRWADSLKIIRNLQQLQREAPRSGGKVVVVLGNHEAMNLLGDFRYTTAGEYAAFVDGDSAARRDRVYELNRATIEATYRATDPKLSAADIRKAWEADMPLGWVEHKLAWQPSGELGRWASDNPAVAKIGDTLFVHGGLSAEYARLGISTINAQVGAAMRRADDSGTSILTDPLGPLWYRGLATRDPKADPDGAAAAATKPRPPIEEELATALGLTGTKRMVIAHTPILSGIAILYGGKLARIDTGISRAYGGPLTWLEINGNQMIPHTIGRPAS